MLEKNDPTTVGFHGVTPTLPSQDSNTDNRQVQAGAPHQSEGQRLLTLAKKYLDEAVAWVEKNPTHFATSK